MTDWEKLRRRVKREKRQWESFPSTNRAQRETAAAMTAAYNSVLWMMERVEESRRRNRP